MRPLAVIVGARKGTEAEYKLEIVRAFLGRCQNDFTRSAAANCYPLGTLATIGGEWYEIKLKPVSEWCIRYPLPVEKPHDSEIVR